MRISKRAYDLIVKNEVGSRAEYDSKLVHTDWPGGASGVTIGIGFDVGMSTIAELRTAWGAVLPAEMVSALERACGVTGTRANALAEELAEEVTIPYETAIKVFQNYDVPHEESKTIKALPNCDKLSADSFGALVSLVYNRGASFSTEGERYTEMRNIKRFMTTKEFDKIPQEFRSMKRLWYGHALDGLLRRRDEEAQMFLEGLGKPAIGPVIPVGPVVPPVVPPAPAKGLVEQFFEWLASLIGGGKRS